MARTTRTKSTDYTQMAKHAKDYIGRPAFRAIGDFAAKRQIANHRAGKVFWGLVDDGEIVCSRRRDGIEMVEAVR